MWSPSVFRTAADTRRHRFVFGRRWCPIGSGEGRCGEGGEGLLSTVNPPSMRKGLPSTPLPTRPGPPRHRPPIPQRHPPHPLLYHHLAYRIHHSRPPPVSPVSTTDAAHTPAPHSLQSHQSCTRAFGPTRADAVREGSSVWWMRGRGVVGRVRRLRWRGCWNVWHTVHW